jgi:hypothetical protein
MRLPPLTHHEILGLVEPFSRRGRRVDLDASDRLARRLVWKPVERPASLAVPSVREELELENPYTGTFRLTRRLVPAVGPAASLVVEGKEPGALLEGVESIAPERQLRCEAGFVVALSHHAELAEGAAGAAAKSDLATRLLLVQGVAEVGGLTVVLKLPTVRRLPGDIKIVAKAADVRELPEDLLSVIGWDWAPLRRVGEEWGSKLRLRGRGPERSRLAELKLERTARHLAEALAEPPPRFHERFVMARWGAVVRRTFPVLTALAVVLVAAFVPVKFVEANPIMRLAIMNGSLLLIAMSFTLQELSRLELPRLPRRSTASSWRVTQAPAPEAEPKLDVLGATSAARGDP